MADGKPDALLTIPLVRGRFCELMAPVVGIPGHASDLFLLGLLSVMDAILDQPLTTVLSDLPVRKEIKEALVARTGLYRHVLDIAIAHERADWEKINALVSKLKLDEGKIPPLYLAAVDWSTSLRSGTRAPVIG
jgi:EAL and modified HD-GYP domain-containing signal transduction protein